MSNEQVLWEAPDVIGFQEVQHHQLLDLANLLPDYGYVGVGRDDGKEAGEVSRSSNIYHLH